MSFQAKYEGDCAQCDDPILPYQEVEYNFNDELQHVVCPEGLNPLSGKPKALCPRCFCELSVTGVCGVCE